MSTLVLSRSKDGIHFAEDEKFHTVKIPSDVTVNSIVTKLSNEAWERFNTSRGKQHATRSLLIVGGKSGNKTVHRNTGVEGVKAFAMANTGGHVLKAHPAVHEIFPGKPILQGTVGGCFEGRDGFSGICEFDGRFSLIFWRQKFWLFARANLDWGVRHTQVVSSDDLQKWGNWSLIHIHGQHHPNRLPKHPSMNIYFMGVHVNPVNASSLFALLPLNDPKNANPSLHGSVCATFSLDGVIWSPLAPLLPSARKGERTVDHPAIGVLCCKDGLVHLYVQHDVPDIATTPLSRITRYSVTLLDFEHLSARSLAHLAAPR